MHSENKLRKHYFCFYNISFFPFYNFPMLLYWLYISPFTASFTPYIISLLSPNNNVLYTPSSALALMYLHPFVLYIPASPSFITPGEGCRAETLCESILHLDNSVDYVPLYYSLPIPVSLVSSSVSVRGWTLCMYV